MTKFTTHGYIKGLGCVKYKVGTRLPDVPTLFIYVIDRGIKVYTHVSYNPNYYLKRWRVWSRTGLYSKLPLPVGRLGSDNVKLYYTQSYPDIDVIRATLSEHVTLLGQKIPSRSKCASVIAIRVPSDPGYYSILKFGDMSKVDYILQAHQDRCVELIDSSGTVNNKSLMNWCKRNSKSVRAGNFQVTVIADEEDPIKAMYLTAKYVMESHDQRMNLFMPVF